MPLFFALRADPSSSAAAVEIHTIGARHLTLLDLLRSADGFDSVVQVHALVQMQAIQSTPTNTKTLRACILLLTMQTVQIRGDLFYSIVYFLNAH